MNIQDEVIITPPIRTRGFEIHPFARRTSLRFSKHVAAAWSRPSSILVRFQDGQEEVLPIPDPTRSAVLTLAGITLVAMLLMRWLSRR